MNNNQPYQTGPDPSPINQAPKKPPKPGEAGERIPHVNRGIAIIAIVIFMIFLVLPTIVWGGLMIASKNDPELAAKINPPTSEHEAAKVYATFPTTFDPKTYTADVEAWYNDHLPFRSLIFNAYERANTQLEKPYEESIRPALLEFFASQSSTPPSNELMNPTETFEEDDQHNNESEVMEEIGSSGVENEETIPDLDFTIETEDETIPEFDNPIDRDEETIPEFENGGDTEPPSEDQLACEHVLDVGSIETPATCSNWGVIKYVCTKNCGYVKRAYTAKAAHTKGVGVIETPATCSEWGVMAYSCTDCGKVVEKAYTAKAEHIKGEGFIETPATCSEWGVMAYPCTVCEKIIDKEYTQKSQHEYVELEYKTPNCGEKYKKPFACTGCGLEKTQTLTKKHVAGKKLQVVEPSYTSYGYTLIRCRDCDGQYRANLKNKLYDNSYFLPHYRSSQVLEGKYKWLFYRNDNSEAYYAGTNLMTDAQLSEYVSVMTQLNELCKSKGITLQLCIWPNKDQVYPEYTGITPQTEVKRVDKLVEYVRSNSDIKIVYPLEELKAAKPYYDMYLKYDTHWNCAGGFVGYQAMMESLGLESMDIKNCPVFEYTGPGSEYADPYYTQIRGDMLGMGGGWSATVEQYPNDHNYFINYRPGITTDSQVGGNGASDTRHTTAQNATYDCNFVMLADSYRVMQLGYLEKDFSDCFLTHRSHVNDANVKEAIKNSDILVIAAVERYETDILATAKQIIKILQEGN